MVWLRRHLVLCSLLPNAMGMGEVVTPFGTNAMAPVPPSGCRICRDSDHSRCMRDTVPLAPFATTIWTRLGPSPDIREGTNHQEAWRRGPYPCPRSTVASGLGAYCDWFSLRLFAVVLHLMMPQFTARCPRSMCVYGAKMSASLTHPPPSAKGAALRLPSFAALTFPRQAGEDLACRKADHSPPAGRLGGGLLPAARG
jgi:hypothetical protein